MLPEGFEAWLQEGVEEGWISEPIGDEYGDTYELAPNERFVILYAEM